jgi:hypothetical protein
VATTSAERSTVPDGAAWPAADRAVLAQAILRAMTYADIFDYPLTAAEVHRYLAGVAASPETVQAYLEAGVAATTLHQHGGFFTLPGREEIVATRRRRAVVAARLWPRAVRYGRLIATLPFVRMVAVTGALAMDNVEPSADIDYLIVTEPGRLWLCRAVVIGLVRLAALRGDTICPNYFLAESALVLRERTIFTAHELAQMVPLAGLATYHAMRQCNAWSTTFLPNAAGPPVRARENYGQAGSPWRLRSLAETVLRSRAGERLERWEMTRKVRKLNQQRTGATEADFGADWCKGHLDGHGQRILAAYADRLHALEGMTP